MLLEILRVKKLLERFTKKNYKNQIKPHQFRAQKVTMRKRENLDVKCKGYDSWNDWAHKRDIV